MSDGELRRLERLSLTGDPDARIKLLAIRWRDGHDFFCESAREAILDWVYVGMAQHCPADNGGCGARVRLIALPVHGGSWICPVCGVALPFTFWKVKNLKPYQDADREYGIKLGLEVSPNQRYWKVTDQKQVILELAPGACPWCGEGNPPCRCDRKAEAEKTEREQAERAKKLAEYLKERDRPGDYV